jgi:phosphonoacetaldehyde hydrolase
MKRGITMKNKIKMIIFDGAGTLFDDGCFAPINAFVKAFEKYGVFPTINEIREPMGIEKCAHITKMLESERLASLWLKKHGRCHTVEDIKDIYLEFESVLFKTLPQYTDPIFGVVETIKQLRERGIAIGATTGYSKAMMDVIMPFAKEKGYLPDFIVCPENVGKGRPYPYMIWENLKQFGVINSREAVKIGDTVADISEGVNANCWSVGVVLGSSEMGLSCKEINTMSMVELNSRKKIVREKFYEAGADYVVEDITELLDVISDIERKLKII